MVVTSRRDGIDRHLGSADVREHLVRRFGAQRATTLYTYHQLLSLHGPVEAQRVLGPERYVELLIALRGAGFDV
ncbi:MAG: hypothetical protein IT340_04995 [Chloroflexi bacterium]|nr:hypothetical protein [Chloroflexota bacterium]